MAQYFFLMDLLFAPKISNWGIGRAMLAVTGYQTFFCPFWYISVMWLLMMAKYWTLNSVNFQFRLLSVSHFDFWVVKLSYLPWFLDLFIPHRSNWNWRWGGIKTYHNLAVKHSFWGKREPGLQSVLIKLMWLAYEVTKIKCCFGENFRINELMYECPKKSMKNF